MSEKLKEMSATALMDLTTSDAPAPGDGSAPVPFGSLSATLMGMVAGPTVGEKKYIEVEAEMCEAVAAAKALKEELIEEIDHDSDFFNELMAATVLPKNTDEEKAARKAVMQSGLKSTAKVSCYVTETVVRIFPLAKTVVERDNTNTVTDGLVAAMAVRIAVIGAGLNVKTNLASVEDEDLVVEYSAHVAALEEQAVAAERETFAPPELTREI